MSGRIRVAVVAIATLAVLLALQRISAAHQDPSWDRANEWRHDLSLFAALLVGAAVVGSRSFSRIAARRPGPQGHPAARREEHVADAVRSAAAGVAGAAVFTFALVGAFAAAFGAAERAVVPLAVAAFLTAAALIVRTATRPLTVAALAIVAAASWGAHAFDTVSQDDGAVLVAPTYPLELYAENFVDDDSSIDVEASKNDPPDGPARGLRRGDAPVVIDLRHLQIADGETLHLDARSDLNRVVVALPTDRCWDVRAKVNVLSRRPPMLVRVAADTARLRLEHRGGPDSSTVFPQGDDWIFGADPPPTFHRSQTIRVSGRAVAVAWGERIGDTDGRPVTITRAAADPRRAAHLALTAEVGTELVIRDFPDDLPLTAVVRNAAIEDASETADRLLAWPAMSVRQAQSEMGGVNATQPTTLRGATTLARQAAGACATREALARRWVRMRAGTAISTTVTVGNASGIFSEPALKGADPGSVTYVNGLGQERRVELTE